MRRVAASLEVGGMTGIALGRGAAELVAFVASVACQGSVSASQGIAGVLHVVELGADPGIH